MVAFFIGLMTGCCLGTVVAGLCMAARRSSDISDDHARLRAAALLREEMADRSARAETVHAERARILADAADALDPTLRGGPQPTA